MIISSLEQSPRLTDRMAAIWESPSGFIAVSAAAASQGGRTDDNQDDFQLMSLTGSSEIHSRDGTIGAMMLVADGIGGGEHGALASREACHSFVNNLRRECGDRDFPGDEPEAVKRILFGFIDQTQRHLEGLGLAGRFSKYMGTTLSALCLIGDKVYLVYAGDSRVYRYREPEGLVQLSRDQTEAQQLIDEASADPETAERELGHILTEAITSKPHQVAPGWWSGNIEDADRFLLCSDGLSTFVPPSELSGWMSSSVIPESKADGLLSNAFENETQDDCTSIVVEVSKTP